MSDDRVMEALARLENGLAKLENSVAGLEAGQARLEREVTRLRVDSMTRFETIEDRLTAIREDIGVNMGRADLAADTAGHNRKELGQLWRMIQRVQTRVDHLENRSEPRPD